jgi:hypothetical protein
MPILNHGTRSGAKTPLQADLSGTYSLCYRTLELKPNQLVCPPDPNTRQVYSIRIGTKRQTLIYVNHTDRTAESTTIQYKPTQWPDVHDVVFQYSKYKYSFMIEPAFMLKSDEVIEVTLIRL